MSVRRRKTMAEKEYIEREAVEKFITKGLNNPDKSKAYGYDAVEILSEVHYMDAADVVEIKYGKWVEVDDGVLIYNGKHLECSECRTWKRDWQKSNYCPSCGVKMSL